MENGIIIGILMLIIGAVIFYLVRRKKKGDACIGCPYSKRCGGSCTKQPTEKDQASPHP